MHELPAAWLPNSRSANDDDDASCADAPRDTEQDPQGAEWSRISDRLHVSETPDSSPNKVSKTTRKIAYDVDLPKPIEVPNVISPEAYNTYSSSSDSETSNFSLPKLSAKTEAELLAILAEDKESTSGRTSISEHRYSPLLNRERETTTLSTFQESRISASRSPSLILLHESMDNIPSQDKTEPQNYKTNLKRLLSEYASPEPDPKRLKRGEAHQEVIELGDTE
jgi:hypothetical protein